MDRFNCRSPYIISVDGDAAQIGTKIFLEIYSQDDILLSVKEIEKKMFSHTQRINYYNISPFVYDILNTLDANYFGCVVYVHKSWYDGTTYTDFEDLTLVATNGYSDYSNANYLQSRDEIVLTNNSTNTIYYDRTLTYPTIDLIIDFVGNPNTYYSRIRNGSFNQTNSLSNDSINFFRLQMTSSNSNFDKENYFEIYSQYGSEIKIIYQVKLENICEPKYNPIKLDFINRLGGKQSMYFFKNSTQTIEVKGSDYNTNTFSTYPTYDTNLGQKRVYNKNGSKIIKCNSGWISEAENINIQDIMLSENLLLTYDENGATVTKAVTLKNSSQLFKTHLNEKVINYELEFEVASQLINNVV